jgi:hypothetical protein
MPEGHCHVRSGSKGLAGQHLVVQSAAAAGMPCRSARGWEPLHARDDVRLRTDALRTVDHRDLRHDDLHVGLRGEELQSSGASSKVKPEATDAVRSEWLRRVEAEYRSAAITQHLTLWLMQMGASPDLVRAGLRIASDEITHAEMSHVVYGRAGGEATPSLARETLELPRRTGEPLEHDVARVGVEIFCLGETVAVPLFKELRQECTVPAARRALDRILRDEVRHRDFGWTLLEWLLDLPIAGPLRALITRELPGWFRALRGAYAPQRRAREPSMTADERAWGLMPLSLYRAAVDKAFQRDWQPRFRRLGVDAEAAWSA